MASLVGRLVIDKDAEYQPVTMLRAYSNMPGKCWGFIDFECKVHWDVVREYKDLINNGLDWGDVFVALFKLYEERYMKDLDTERVRKCIKEVAPYFYKHKVNVGNVNPDNYIELYKKHKEWLAKKLAKQNC